jgi:hypothetical protein
VDLSKIASFYLAYVWRQALVSGRADITLTSGNRPFGIASMRINAQGIRRDTCCAVELSPLVAQASHDNPVLRTYICLQRSPGPIIHVEGLNVVATAIPPSRNLLITRV